MKPFYKLRRFERDRGTPKATSFRFDEVSRAQLDYAQRCLEAAGHREVTPVEVLRRALEKYTWELSELLEECTGESGRQLVAETKALSSRPRKLPSSYTRPHTPAVIDDTGPELKALTYVDWVDLLMSRPEDD